MKILDSMASLRQLDGDALLPAVRRLLISVVSPRWYCPENDGYLVLIEPPDIATELDELGLSCPLHEVQFEGVSLKDGLFHAIYLANNQFVLSFLIPDADWVTPELRQHLIENLER